MTTTDTTPAEALIALIMDSPVLTDEKKEFYLSELAEGRIPEELLNSLEHLCDATIAAETAESQKLEAEIAAQETALAEAQREDDREAADLIKEHEGALTRSIGEYKQHASAIERNLDKGMEEVVRTEKDDKEAATLRAMLKQKPDDSSQPGNQQLAA